MQNYRGRPWNLSATTTPRGKTLRRIDAESNALHNSDESNKRLRTSIYLCDYI